MKLRERGLSLVELMVALAIGSVLIAGAVYVYSQSRTSQRVSDTLARLQENGRFVLSIIEPDVQLAGYYGFTNSANEIRYIQDGNTASSIPAVKIGLDGESDVVGGPQDCGTNFAINVAASIEGSNDSYPFGVTCAAQGGGAQPETDTLTIRRAGRPPADGIGAAVEGRTQLLVSRLSPTNVFMFSDGKLPPSPTPTADLVQVRDLVVRTYYVAQSSTDPDQPGLPALRVKSLVDNAFVDEELMRGVEDLQVQFGYDTGSYDGNLDIDAGLDEDGNGIPDAPNGIATRYVDPGEVPNGFQVVAVRVWVLLRAEQPEVGYVDGKTYEYAGKTVGPKNDNFRRVLMSRTIQLRNSRTL